MSIVESHESISQSAPTRKVRSKPKLGPKVICLGNEKGGSGKSTTAMHIVVALMSMGQRVGAIDLDSRQQSLARYIYNRQRWSEKYRPDLPIPRVATVERSVLEERRAAEADEKRRFQMAFAELGEACDYLVIDCPGNDTHLSRLGHSIADIIVTPINDSFVDLDLLADIDPETNDIIGPSFYTEMIWQSRKKRATTDRASIDWILMRNRLSSLDAKNKRRVSEALDKLAPRSGFRLAPGFSERVIYRELFPLGLTVLDLGEALGGGVKLSMSHLAARQELRDLMVMLNLPGLEEMAATF